MLREMGKLRIVECIACPDNYFDLGGRKFIAGGIQQQISRLLNWSRIAEIIDQGFACEQLDEGCVEQILDALLRDYKPRHQMLLMIRRLPSHCLEGKALCGHTLQRS
jgi:hypothetical protein